MRRGEHLRATTTEEASASNAAGRESASTIAKKRVQAISGSRIYNLRAQPRKEPVQSMRRVEHQTDITALVAIGEALQDLTSSGAS